ncbi:MAG TPA: SDR family oxidoreductase [Candidatus Acidoferrum sp.]|nr:SDR family oxidoreductase [Candidatus Acidoferrum sp.]
MSTGQVVMITGASSGFGRLISETLARKGYRVFATMRALEGKNAARARELRELAERESLWLRPLELDVTEDASVERAVGRAIDEAGRIDVAVNNAGYGLIGVTEAATLEQARRIMDTNFMGAVRVNRAVLPHMRRQKSGLLIHISSGAGRVVVPGMGFYCASKWALEALAEEYRYELDGQYIDSVIIQPGAYPTAVFDKIERTADIARTETYGAVNSIAGRVLGMLAGSKRNPQEVANAVLETIETPFGRRKLRQRIGSGVDGISELNELSGKVQAQILESFGVATLAGK